MSNRDGDGANAAAVDGEPVAAAVREHELASAEWEYQPAARTLHGWFQIFNRRLFEDRLPLTYLRLDRGRAGWIGGYRRGRNGVGALHEIRVNSTYLAIDPHDLLGALLREMVHEWQGLFGKPARGRYVNQEFAAKCAAVGIPCQAGYSSHTLRYDEPFLSILREEGIEIPQECEPLRPQAGESKLKKWACRCYAIRAAGRVRLVCEGCGETLRREEAKSANNRQSGRGAA